MRTYMEKVGATYYFRRVVPEPLRPYFVTTGGKPRTEFKESLRTKDRKEADRRLELKSVQISSLLDEAEGKLAAGIAPSQADAGRKWDDWQDSQIELQEAADKEALQREFQEAEEDLDLAAEFDRPNHELTPKQRVIKRNLDAALFAPPEVTAAQQKQREAEERRGAAEAVEAFKKGTLGKGYTTLTVVFDRYLEITTAKPASIKKWRTAMDNLKVFLGHDDASRITKQDVHRWRDSLLKRGLSVASVRNGYIGGARAVFQVAADEELIKFNPVLGVLVRPEKKARLRDGKDFKDAEVQLILKGTLASPPRNLSPFHALARRWVPWVCAYTGARVNEITQLRECDIFQDGGIWVIKITPEAGTVKSGQARTVPLHDHLISQGFQNLGVAASTRPLFYDPGNGRGAKSAHTHNQKIGERLAHWVRQLGVTDQEVRPNHGWRHLFKTRGYQSGIPDSALNKIMGHAAPNVGETYGQWPVIGLKREIDKMPRFELLTD